MAISFGWSPWLELICASSDTVCEEMGNSAKFKLNQMAEQFKQNTNRFANPNGAGRGANPDSPRNEMRGLLDRDDSYDAYELASRKDL